MQGHLSHQQEKHFICQSLLAKKPTCFGQTLTNPLSLDSAVWSRVSAPIHESRAVAWSVEQFSAVSLRTKLQLTISQPMPRSDGLGAQFGLPSGCSLCGRRWCCRVGMPRGRPADDGGRNHHLNLAKTVGQESKRLGFLLRWPGRLPSPITKHPVKHISFYQHKAITTPPVIPLTSILSGGRPGERCRACPQT